VREDVVGLISHLAAQKSLKLVPLHFCGETQVTKPDRKFPPWLFEWQSLLLSCHIQAKCSVL